MILFAELKIKYSRVTYPFLNKVWWRTDVVILDFEVQSYPDFVDSNNISANVDY